MIRTTRSRRDGIDRHTLNLARVLLVHGELAPRLTLQTILQAGGYMVDVAATPSEALGMLDEGRYDLVLIDGESASGRNVLAYARVKEYKPATAMVTSHGMIELRRSPGPSRQSMSIYTENLPLLLEKVAELIGVRAIRRYRPARQTI
jgi:CheY-like chemotaxis protein